MNKLTPLLLAALLSLPAAAADDPLEDGRQLYEFYCSICHGLTADGWGINAPYMKVQPSVLTAEGEMNTRTDEELVKVIKEGGKGVSKSALMPRFGDNLSDPQINTLVAYIRSLCCATGNE